MISHPTTLEDALRLVRVDLAPRHRQPSAVMVVVATAASLVGSLLADAALVAIGTAVFPSTKGFVHFRFSDYAKLTVIGVVVACIAWPIVTRISSAPRWLYLRLAVVVTLVLLVPDVWILLHGEPAQGGRRPHGHAPGHRRGHLQLHGAHRPGRRPPIRHRRDGQPARRVTMHPPSRWPEGADAGRAQRTTGRSEPVGSAGSAVGWPPVASSFS